MIIHSSIATTKTYITGRLSIPASFTMGDMADPASVLRRRVPGETPRPVGGSHGEACSDDHLIPPAKWTFNKNGVPQAIAHRGYKVKFPENTMGAFRGAIEAGAHALETDLHLSKDNVVVISHVRSTQAQWH